MDLIVTMVIGVLTLLGASVAKLLADEFKAWAPSIVEKIVSFAVRRAPQHLRERLAEEWRSHVNETPGDLGKLCVALGFIWASGKLRNKAERTVPDAKASAKLGEPAETWKRLLELIGNMQQTFKIEYVGRSGEVIDKEPVGGDIAVAIKHAELKISNSHEAAAPGQQRVGEFIIFDDVGREVHRQRVGD
jgi:hypothetical protein